MKIDWGDGEYERTARQLAPVASVVVDTAAIGPGERVLDAGTGTGNAALAAARRGAIVDIIDPSAGLIERATRRLGAAGFAVNAAVEAAEDVSRAPVYDHVVSVFAVIFSQHPERALRALAGALRPGGRLTLAAWVPGRGLSAATDHLRTALIPDTDSRSNDPWRDPGSIRRMLHDAGLTDVRIDEHELATVHESARAWLVECEEHHPVWRFARSRLPAASWRAVHDLTLRELEVANTATAGFAITTPFRVVTALTG